MAMQSAVDGKNFIIRALNHGLVMLCLSLLMSACSTERFAVETAATELPLVERSADNTAAPAIRVSPSSGYAGTYVQVSGSGWTNDEVITIVLADERGTSGILSAAGADADGTFTTGFLYPLNERWLVAGQREVLAMAAGGERQASALFTVAPPDDVEPPTPVPPTATATPTANPTGTATPSPTPPSTNTALPSPTPLPPATPTPPATPPPTATPVLAVDPLPATPSVVANAAAQRALPLVQGALVPLEERGNRIQVRVDVAAAEDALGGTELVPVLAFAPLEGEEEIKLKAHPRKFKIKWKEGALEIQAPNPEQTLAQMQRLGGIPVQDGQVVVFSAQEQGGRSLAWEDEELRVQAPSLDLVLFALEGAEWRAVASSTLDPAQRGDGRGNEGRGSDDDVDDRGRDEDDKRGKKNDDRGNEDEDRGRDDEENED